MERKIETAVLSAGVAAAADQIMAGIKDNREGMADEAKRHYINATIAGAIAVGAYQLMQRENKGELNPHPELSGKKGTDGELNPQPELPGHSWTDHLPSLMAEAAGAYAAGRQLMGSQDTSQERIIKLVAEGLGAVALAKNTTNAMEHQG
ncbi:hypothetical protein QBC47DRAFT_394521 [Echria macrotheca]|uniref:Uncharacterized protein n=1 Tax=Echria macrotheca TaxID=438768 RepID=A0AAJ0B1R1_9PEZI|nr:hypothetical protein QBC47DRAFT_394521 [Echria macrotheca]